MLIDFHGDEAKKINDEKKNQNGRHHGSDTPTLE
jgi:hypothetical protein